MLCNRVGRISRHVANSDLVLPRRGQINLVIARRKEAEKTQIRCLRKLYFAQPRAICEYRVRIANPLANLFRRGVIIYGERSKGADGRPIDVSGVDGIRV
ncbi:hypothetical protein SDC9_125327 [bioreactor metagenome]|uniref:Uncharacterized protein n=1 Tax=bioreactor metagenome TaxID=1076179 RepID=A0A645CMR2_9ZZZZ